MPLLLYHVSTGGFRISPLGLFTDPQFPRLWELPGLQWEHMTDGHPQTAAVWRSLFKEYNDPYETLALLTPRNVYKLLMMQG
jgi:hypothetical protein